MTGSYWQYELSGTVAVRLL